MLGFLKRSQKQSSERESTLSQSQINDADGDDFLIRLFRAHNMTSTGGPTLYSVAAYEIISVRKELAHAYRAGHLAGEGSGLSERTALAAANDSLKFENDSLRKENRTIVDNHRKMLLFLAEQQAKGNIDRLPKFDDLT